MLETINLTKIYKPKKGVPVRALDGITLKLPDTGMVFLLGKSGSGKSTLLNLLGGLDKYDGGDIIIKGVSSKDFKQQHFDSYRNTYVGFIFQEYNVLEEFTVGANIALALELQGRKATDAEINRILDEVDLSGYGSRRPNELSGGQKQRVAIARALVKTPKIIMADEPSGALDSETGKQVFETLKKLSKEKLVIVVSHDRDFADTYADRIIELADGRVISDMTVRESEDTEECGIVFDGATATVPADYRLTEEDRLAINEYLDRLKSGCTLEFADRARTKSFSPTEEGDVIVKDNTPFKLIKSKLSLRHAFKIGASGLKHKKFRLVMTVLLSCIAFTLFGLVNTFTSYKHIETLTNSLLDSRVSYASVTSERRIDDDDMFWYGMSTRMTDEDIAKLASETGLDFKGVFGSSFGGLYFFENLAQTNSVEYGFNVYASSFSGMVELGNDDLQSLGFELTHGKLPDGSRDEIAISEYIVDSFIEHGYCKDYNGKKVNISSGADMIGKTLIVNNREYTVVGVVDTKLDKARYASLYNAELDGGSASDQIIDYVLYNEFSYETNHNYTGMMLLGKGGIKRYLDTNTIVTEMNYGSLGMSNDDGRMSCYTVAKLSNVKGEEIIWLDGERKTLGDREIVISSVAAEQYFAACTFDGTGNLKLDKDALSGEFKLEYVNYMTAEEPIVQEGYKIVGVINHHEMQKGSYYDLILPDSFYSEYIALGGEGIYDSALATMPSDRGDVRRLVEYLYTEREDERYLLNNPVSFELDALHELIVLLADVFVYVGIAFAIFASILLSNFIATSISYKKQEIGILRAIGSRGNDVFRIFFAESFIIAMINFALSCLGTWFVTAQINEGLRDSGLLVTVLNFGIKQIAVILLISVAVAAVASFLPVKRIASKKPIDAIRNR